MLISVKYSMFLNVHNDFDNVSFEKYLEVLNLLSQEVCVFIHVAEGPFFLW